MNRYYIITRHFVIVCTEEQYKAKAFIEEPLLTVTGDIYHLPHAGIISFTGVLIAKLVTVKYDPNSLVLIAP